MASLVFLGAGASYGSVGSVFGKSSTDVMCPPLGGYLFDALEARGGVAKSLDEELKVLFRNNFEAGMLELYEQAGGNIMQFQRELGHYLAEFRPTENSVYIDLIKSLGNKRVIYSSLNYDLLFECSASLSGLVTEYSDQFHKGRIRLLKPHGSANFWPDIPAGSIRGCTFQSPHGADIGAPVVCVNQDEAIHRAITEDSLSPAIAMFAEGKKVKVCPEFVEEQKKQWTKAVISSKNIFIIGVRVHQVDEHIWGAIGKTEAEVHYYGLENDRVEFNEWKQQHNKRNAFFHESDFSISVSDIKRRIFK